MENKVLLSELRICEISPVEKITNESLTKAVTVNAEINNFGFTLLPKDIVRLACDKAPEKVLELIKEIFANKGYKPMYPGFPEEVLNMDEAVYRFHQLLHYFSTYGLEEITGEEVSEGWMPASKFEEKTEDAEKLKELTVIELCTKEEIFDRVEKYIVKKTERWTNGEAELAAEFFKENAGKKFEIPFKENIKHYYEYLAFANEKDVVNKLYQVCQHTGDVLDLINNVKNRNVDFKTSQRRTFCKLLDMFSERDLSENLIRQDIRNKKVLNYISYNKYSRNNANKEVVRKFRNDELRSWNSFVEEKIKNQAEDTLDFIGKRPGELFRRIRQLLNTGYSKEDIKAHINGADLKIQSIVSALNNLCNSIEDAYGKHKDPISMTDEAIEIAKELLVEGLAKYKTPLTGKKVYFDKGQYSPENSILCIDKMEEGGYMRSGLAFAIPENVDIIREFVFWNDDSKRVDVDLHSYAFYKDGCMRHVGWNGDFKGSGLVMSGDITTSKNSAEYIDVNIPAAMKHNIENVTFNIAYFNGGEFRNIEKCFFGIVAAKDDKSKLYDPKNLYFYHDLTSSKKRDMEYAVFNLPTRTIRLLSEKETWNRFYSKVNFSLNDYLQLLGKAQDITFVNDKEDADIVVTLDKQENTYCLIDKNFLLEGDKDYKEEEINIKELEDGSVEFTGSLEECNKLLKVFNGCIGRKEKDFFWKGESTISDVLAIVIDGDAGTSK